MGPPDSLSLPSSVVLSHVMVGLRTGGMPDTCSALLLLGWVRISRIVRSLCVSLPTVLIKLVLLEWRPELPRT